MEHRQVSSWAVVKADMRKIGVDDDVFPGSTDQFIEARTKLAASVCEET